ncbi:endonuclease domain-containing protein [Streptomyces fagopyri]|uniref:endonuclease domain-containing protein n=1 Tax=Streptomyces fagopyri TaxID=2662397 RepID=UPI00381E60AC
MKCRSRCGCGRAASGLRGPGRRRHVTPPSSASVYASAEERVQKPGFFGTRYEDRPFPGLRVICSKAASVHVDQCHRTGRVRGVLCFNCNSAIGKLGVDPDAVRRAAAYLEGSPWKPTLVAPGVYRLPS